MQDEGLPPRVMFVEMEVSVFTVTMRCQPRVRMAVELILVSQGTVDVQRRRLHGSMMMVMIVFIAKLKHLRLLVQAEPHTEPSIQFRVIGQLQESDLRCLFANDVLSI